MTTQQNQEDIGSRTNNIFSRGKIAIIAIAAGAIIGGYMLNKHFGNCTYLGGDYPSWQARYKGDDNWYDLKKDYRVYSPSTPEGFRRLPEFLQGNCKGSEFIQRYKL